MRYNTNNLTYFITLLKITSNMNIKKSISPLLLPILGIIGCKEEIKKPNVIIILADDLGYGDVSAYGAKTINTPNIDRIANAGVCFTKGYSTSSTSTPSRYGMMTGIYPWKDKNARILDGDAPLIISEQQYTLPKMLAANGYKTAAIGKWHLGMGNGNVDWNNHITPNANSIGFNYSCLIAATNDRVPTVYVENGNVVGLESNDPIEINYRKNFSGQPTGNNNPELCTMIGDKQHGNTIINGIPRIGYMKGGKSAEWVDEEMADYFVNKAKDFISQNSKKPFFLYFGLHQPHVPRVPNHRFVGKSNMGARGDAILEADWSVGELMNVLEEKGLLENTIIIFSSDNGPVLNDGYEDYATERLGEHKPTGGLRGGKYSLFEAGTRVPFFVYWKNKTKSIKSDAMVCHLDIMASLASLLKIDIPDNLDSQNLQDVFLGKSTKGRESLILEAGGRIAFRNNKYVLIPPYKGEKISKSKQIELGNYDKFTLFDIENDVFQQNDITDENINIVEKLKKEFLEATKGYYKYSR